MTTEYAVHQVRPCDEEQRQRLTRRYPVGDGAVAGCKYRTAPDMAMTHHSYNETSVEGRLGANHGGVGFPWIR